MTLWLTLLLVWTTGIPAALFITVSVATALNERRMSRLPALALHSHRPGCGRRAHPCDCLAVASQHPMRARAGARRRY